MDDYITIVSGLPRSGTSMMMRMLEAGGMEIVVDNIRKADEDNPLGYFEFEKVKKIKEDTSWLPGMEGKAFKMVSMLLYDLPLDRRYKIIFMKRNMREIMASQRKMLRRQHRAHDGVSDDEMARISEKHLDQMGKWLEGIPHFDVLYIVYHDVIENPHKSAETVNRFLKYTLDVDRMIQVVDHFLYRNRL